MSKFIIEGGKRLEGEVKISGSKNAALPIIAATILNAGKTTLYNVPDIQDVQTMFEIIKDIGGKVNKKRNKIIIDTSEIHTYEIPDNLMRQMRSSVILAGALIGKYHKARFSCPGDCDIWWIYQSQLSTILVHFFSAFKYVPIIYPTLYCSWIFCFPFLF